MTTQNSALTNLRAAQRMLDVISSSLAEILVEPPAHYTPVSSKASLPTGSDASGMMSSYPAEGACVMALDNTAIQGFDIGREAYEFVRIQSACSTAHRVVTAADDMIDNLLKAYLTKG